MNWIRESEALPRIAQSVLFAVPRQLNEFWDISVAEILVRHEDVHPTPVSPGDKMPVDYWWERSRSGKDTHLLTGHGWWAPLTDLVLPPGAEHKRIRDYDCIVQTE